MVDFRPIVDSFDIGKLFLALHLSILPDGCPFVYAPFAVTVLLYSVQIEKRSFRQPIFPEEVTDWLVNRTISDPFQEDLELRFSS